jgi:hypothetical protein
MEWCWCGRDVHLWRLNRDVQFGMCPNDFAIWFCCTYVRRHKWTSLPGRAIRYVPYGFAVHT